MPYIEKERRRDLQGPSVMYNAGELNYQITQLLLDYIAQRGGLRYQKINDCLGALEGAKLELYRRVAAPYEDTKLLQNGDVY